MIQTLVLFYLLVTMNPILLMYQFFLLNPTKDFNVFEKLPRTFTITTKNGSCNFNKEFLNYTSSTIRSFLISNPDKLQFKIAIIDERNVLEKNRSNVSRENCCVFKKRHSSLPEK